MTRDWNNLHVSRTIKTSYLALILCMAQCCFTVVIYSVTIHYEGHGGNRGGGEGAVNIEEHGTEGGIGYATCITGISMSLYITLSSVDGGFHKQLWGEQ